MKKYLALLAVLPLLVAAQCNNPPRPVPVPMADAAPAPTPAPTPAPIADAAPPVTPAGVVCSNLHEAGCDEGKSASACTKVIQHALDGDSLTHVSVTKIPMSCLLVAHDKGSVHACGSFITCP